MLIDSLEADLASLQSQQPLICMEIGYRVQGRYSHISKLPRSGSGCVITFLASLLGKDRVYFAVDINSHAIAATLKTSAKNGVSLESRSHFDESLGERRVSPG